MVIYVECQTHIDETDGVGITDGSERDAQMT